MTTPRKKTRCEILLDKIEEALHQARNEYYYEHDVDRCGCSIAITDYKYIDIMVFRNGKKECVVCDANTEREFPNVEAFVEASLPDFKDIELDEPEDDIDQQNGFASEADCWRYKEGA